MHLQGESTQFWGSFWGLIPRSDYKKHYKDFLQLCTHGMCISETRNLATEKASL